MLLRTTFLRFLVRSLFSHSQLRSTAYQIEMGSQTYNWFEDNLQSQARPVDIKVESALESLVFPLLSPPSSPPTEPAVSLVSTSPHRRTNTSIVGSKRLKPYPIKTRELSIHREDIGTMANTWTPPGNKGASRRSSEDDQQAPASYGLPNTFATVGQSIRMCQVSISDLICSNHLVVALMAVPVHHHQHQV